MHIFIDNKSGAPIYDQIKTQIKTQIISGELQPDELLPSIRGLAKDLRISFITTKRAYDDLLTEAGVEFLLGTQVTDVIREGNRIGACVLSAKSGVFAVKAKIYIDCTGDGELSFFAGAASGSIQGLLWMSNAAGLPVTHSFAWRHLVGFQKIRIPSPT